MAKKESGAAAKPSGGDGAKDFALDEQHAESMRAAMDDTVGDGLTGFWARMGTQMGFDPESVVITKSEDTGPVSFRAVPVEPAAGDDAAPVVAAEGEAGGQGDDDELEDYEAQNKIAQDRMIDASVDMPLDGGVLAGDLTEAIIEIIKRMRKPFDQHTQFEKRDLVETIKICAANLVQGAVDAVASEGRTTITAYVESIAVGEKTKISLKMGAMGDDAAADAIGDLYRLLKKQVQIVTSDATHHMGKRREHIPEDQEPLPFDAGTDPKAEPPAGGEAAATGEGGEAAEAEENEVEEVEEQQPSDVDGDAPESQTEA